MKDLIPLYYDNMSNIHLARNPVFHARTKHIEVHYHEHVQVGDVDLQHIGTNLQVADIFTEALGVDMLRTFISNLGLTIVALLSLRGSTTQPISTTQQ